MAAPDLLYLSTDQARFDAHRFICDDEPIKRDDWEYIRTVRIGVNVPFIDLLNWYTHEATVSTTLTIHEVVAAFLKSKENP